MLFYSLVAICVATALLLLAFGAVVALFAGIGSVHESELNQLGESSTSKASRAARIASVAMTHGQFEQGVQRLLRTMH